MLCSGKSTLLETIADREIPIPNHFDIFHLSEEIPVSDMTPLECVMEVDEERYLNVLHSFGRWERSCSVFALFVLGTLIHSHTHPHTYTYTHAHTHTRMHAYTHTHTHTRALRLRLEKEAEELTKAGETDSERLMDIYERLDELDAATAETKAARILHGLGWYMKTCVSYMQSCFSYMQSCSSYMQSCSSYMQSCSSYMRSCSSYMQSCSSYIRSCSSYMGVYTVYPNSWC